MATPLTDLVDEEKFWPRLQALSECLCTALAEAHGPALCYCGLWVGDAQPYLGPIMNGCSGIAWVRPVQTFPSLIFPEPAEASSRPHCSTPLAMQVEIGVARAMPRPADARTMPDPQQMYDAARLYMSDMAAVHKALACCFGNSKDPERREWQFALGDWTPLPSGAGVSGGSWFAFIG